MVILVSITVSIRLTIDQEDRVGVNMFSKCELYAYCCHAFMVLLVKTGHCSGGLYVTSGVDKSLPRRDVCDLSSSIE